MSDRGLSRERGADLLAIGFGTAVGMWAVGYFVRLFGDAVPAPILFALLIAVLLIGGFVAGRWTGRGVGGWVACGTITGLINLLIVGSLISGQTPNSIRAGALLWVPGTLVVCVLLIVLGALVGRAVRPAGTPPRSWLGGLAVVAAVATFVLLGAGGLVTGYDEGLAVVDWPNSEGYNMFLYPLARMTGGVYLEHAHRLLGSLVGLTTLVLAIHITLTERRRYVTTLAWVTLVAVVFQGVLGGLRVTGRLTLSTDPADTSPSIILAIVHGVFGQMVFAMLVALAAVRSRTWLGPTPANPHPVAGTDRVLAAILAVLVISQLVLGALVRHFTWALEINRYELKADPKTLIAIGDWALTLHVTFAVLVLLMALAVAVRAWGLYPQPILSRSGRALLVLVGVQLVLGLGALWVTGDEARHREPAPHDVAITTLHQVAGAAILACTILIWVWNIRLARVATRAG